MSKTEQWYLAPFWNAVALKEDRPLVKRDYAYASEIGGAMIDRYLKMCAVTPTNPPNDRSLRKFWSGAVWEYVVKTVLFAAGIYKAEEVVANGEPYSDCLPVHGRLDFIAGGYIDKEECFFRMQNTPLPDFLQPIADKFIDNLAGRNLEKRILEIKSVAMYTLEYVEKRKSALNGHVCQSYHYKRFGGLPASVAYISKDTALMAEFMTTEAAEPIYREDLVQITHYFTKREMPPPEPLLMYDPAVCTFRKNVIGVEYSNYLTMLYGFKSPDEYRRAIEPTIKRWNTALESFAIVSTGGLTEKGNAKKVTPLQAESAKEIQASGFDFKDLVQEKINQIKKEGIPNE